MFLPGAGGLGSGYQDLGTRWAMRGMFAIMVDTGWTPDLQRDNSVALFHAWTAENLNPSSPFFGALNLQKAAITGHSLGGGNALRILGSQNPGFVVGMSLAAGGSSIWTLLHAPVIDRPIMLIHGVGDQVVPWQASSQSYYQNAIAFTGIKSLYVLNQDCNHFNIAVVGPSSVDQQVFDRCFTVGTGFMERFLFDDPSALEESIGPTALTEARLHLQDLDVQTPETWSWPAPQVGVNTDFHLACEGQLAGLFAALAPGSTPTPFGTLGLCPASLFPLVSGIPASNHLLSFSLPLPNDPALAGFSFHVQGVGLTVSQGPRLSNVLDQVVLP